MTSKSKYVSRADEPVDENEYFVRSGSSAIFPTNLWNIESTRGYDNNMLMTCGPYEKLWRECLHRTGEIRAGQRCKMFIQDLNECKWSYLKVCVFFRISSRDELILSSFPSYPPNTCLSAPL